MLPSPLFSLTLGLLLCIYGYGQGAGNPDSWCREGIFTQETKNFGVGFVKPKIGNRSYFYNDDPEKCPKSESCRSRSYLVKGDMVIVSKTFGVSTCSWYTGPRGSVKVGWIRSQDLEFPAMLTDGSERVWTGEWQYASNSISFTPNKIAGYLNVTGNAIWKGMGDNIHIGELDGKAQPENGLLEYSDGSGKYDCRATMRLTMESLLVVTDNGNCGGANVTFSGIYRKLNKKPQKK